MEDLMEMEAVGENPRLAAVSTKTSLSDRFKQMCKPQQQAQSIQNGSFMRAARRKVASEFDLEHSTDPEFDGGQIVRNASLSPGVGNEMLALQYAAKQRQELQNQQIITQARLAAHAELAAVLGTSGFAGMDYSYPYGVPSVPQQPRGVNRFTAGLLRARMGMGRPSPAVALSLARAPQLPAPFRGRVGFSRGQLHQGLGVVQKGPGSIVKTNTNVVTAGRGRGSPYGNMSMRFRQPTPAGNNTSPSQNKNRKRGNGNGIGLPLSGAGSKGQKWKGEPATKEQLDDDLDQYMAQARKSNSSSSLDKELDAYMKEAKAKPPVVRKTAVLAPPKLVISTPTRAPEPILVVAEPDPAPEPEPEPKHEDEVGDLEIDISIDADEDDEPSSITGDETEDESEAEIDIESMDE